MAAPVSSILTRSRHLSFPRIRAALLPGLLLLLVLTNTLSAQDSTAAPPRARAGGDSLAIRTSPMNAFWRSFLLPGWGQARLGRKLTAGLFLAWEGTTLGMTLKTRRELAYLRRTSSARAEDKRREHEDWLVLLAFNHLFAGLEAYVSGHLTDFPGDLRLQAVPGGVGASVSLPFRLR
ncbi:MAG: hypothetical protein M3Q93_09085 [Gemmatimonadota bacterium]|nr:hypothetical protein [Gemmatimonadota bacterium]